ncbi:MAG: 2-amino-4-hydroxy-6-hydroxymethyldihydropteridine diphosphokinase, partial [Candidatus Woesearchaeota archaeon]|nr:2-amino-4-hydroxy-6-hydroxymethyldihydropteridine diphosphokinase [Candidatus Woesearchaeota archaeon]
QFINGVVKIETKFLPYELLKALQKIENDLGRVRKEKWGPRTIDLDILYYDDLKMKNKDLTLPHPHIANRPFIGKALSEMGCFFV